ncbi:hypothetical protein RZN32_30935, partial [Klebsiella pneumoniae]|nr:hypothetical protein [Klebsiella pneumoniae]
MAHENWYKNNDPIAYKFYRDLSPEFETDFYTSETAWLARAKAQAVRPQKYLSHDFNGDGFKYHDSLDEAQ